MNVLSHFGALLAIIGGVTGAASPDTGRVAVQDTHFQKFEAMQRADHEVCGGWIPKIRQAKRLETANKATAYARLTRSAQPAWVERDAARFRSLLNEWMFQNSQYPAPQRSMTRRESDARVEQHLRLGTIRIWQANAKFRAVPGDVTLTRIGLVAIDPAKSPKHVTSADFDRSGYRYVVSRSALPNADQVNPRVDHEILFAFVDKGFTYFVSPQNAALVSSKASLMSLLPSAAREGSFSLNRVCE